jgi:hypothetical protein
MSVYQLTSRREGRGRGGNSCPVPSAIPTCPQKREIAFSPLYFALQPIKGCPKDGKMRDVLPSYIEIYTLLKIAEAEY